MLPLLRVHRFRPRIRQNRWTPNPAHRRMSIVRFLRALLKHRFIAKSTLSVRRSITRRRPRSFRRRVQQNASSLSTLLSLKVFIVFKNHLRRGVSFIRSNNFIRRDEEQRGLVPDWIALHALNERVFVNRKRESKQTVSAFSSANQIKSNHELNVLLNARVRVCYICNKNKREQTYRIKRLVQSVWNHINI